MQVNLTWNQTPQANHSLFSICFGIQKCLFTNKSKTWFFYDVCAFFPESRKTSTAQMCVECHHFKHKFEFKCSDVLKCSTKHCNLMIYVSYGFFFVKTDFFLLVSKRTISEINVLTFFFHFFNHSSMKAELCSAGHANLTCLVSLLAKTLMLNLNPLHFCTFFTASHELSFFFLCF